ncbi:hypothetical protein Salat_1134500 [Sesamum alatum]|uniref:Chromo domain-containing protein n=1 Tax=Sesamum alatum TaxID=300844 RepID=A0AAE1YDP5_9LAMI|nr:hypothetical protein Salat_1134500 [Sesamum alatum]
MADQNLLWNRVAELETQLQLVLNLLGQPPEPLAPALFLQAETLRIRVDAFDTMDVKFGALQDEVNLLKRVVCKTDDRVAQSKNWAQAELCRQGVKDLPSAITAADRLVDFRVTNGPDLDRKKKDSGRDKEKSSKTGRDRKFKKKKKEVTVSGNKDIVQPTFDKSKKGCYLSNGDHRMRDCPKRGKLNALMADANDEDDEGGSTRVNPLQLLSALQEKPLPKHKGLMYVQVQLNDKEVMAMVDIGATHNFVADRETQMLGLTLTQHSSRLKAVNSEAKPIRGIASADLEVGTWKEKCSLMAVPLDDFDVILGMDFLLLAKATEMLDEAKDSLAKAQRRMKKYADMGKRQVEFSVGDKVLLKLTPQIWKKISAKAMHKGLITKYDGPFEILKKVGSLAKEFQKKVVKILGHKTMGYNKKNRRVSYLVHWSDGSEADATWENGVDLWQFERQLVKYWASRDESLLPTGTSGSSGGGGLLRISKSEMLAWCGIVRTNSLAGQAGRDAGRIMAEMLVRHWLRHWPRRWSDSGRDIGRDAGRTLAEMLVSAGAGRRVAEPIECCARRQHMTCGWRGAARVDGRWRVAGRQTARARARHGRGAQTDGYA